MTAEEKAANVALLARVVMGWVIAEDLEQLQSSSGSWTISVPKEGRPWDPYTSIADAMKMLDTFAEYSLTCMGPTRVHTCNVYREMAGKPYRANAAERLSAICAACMEWARAQGEKK